MSWYAASFMRNLFNTLAYPRNIFLTMYPGFSARYIVSCHGGVHYKCQLQIFLSSNEAKEDEYYHEKNRIVNDYQKLE